MSGILNFLNFLFRKLEELLRIEVLYFTYKELSWFSKATMSWSIHSRKMAYCILMKLTSLLDWQKHWAHMFRTCFWIRPCQFALTQQEQEPWPNFHGWFQQSCRWPNLSSREQRGEREWIFFFFLESESFMQMLPKQNLPLAQTAICLSEFSSMGQDFLWLQKSYF